MSIYRIKEPQHIETSVSCSIVYCAVAYRLSAS